MSGALERIARVLSAVVFSLAAITAVRLAVAETLARRDTRESLLAAVRIQRSTPSAEFEQELAELDPAHARAHLRDVVERVNPRSSAAWMELARLGDGESSLLKAAEIDHQYLPAWALTNFYFREENRQEFWMWADRAASLMYDEYPPLFQLCEQFEPDPERLLAHFRASRQMEAPYLKLLMEQNRLDAAQIVARRMAKDQANDPHLVDLADRQIRTQHGAEAMELWNLTAKPQKIDPADGRILVNGDLASAPLNLGFDWRMSQIEGVSVVWRPSELIFRLSGDEPENCVLLEQVVMLPARSSILRFDYLTGSQPAHGIRWSLDGKSGPEITPSEQWRESVFDVPRGHGLARLQLKYRRDPGTTRTEGRMELRNLRVEPKA